VAIWPKEKRCAPANFLRPKVNNDGGSKRRVFVDTTFAENARGCDAPAVLDRKTWLHRAVGWTQVMR
jgi:hypothetical protein